MECLEKFSKIHYFFLRKRLLELAFIYSLTIGKDYFNFMLEKTVLQLLNLNHDGYFFFRNGLGQASKIRIFRSVLHQYFSNNFIVIDDNKYQNCCECDKLTHFKPLCAAIFISVFLFKFSQFIA